MMQCSPVKVAFLPRARFARLYYLHRQFLSGVYPNVPRLAREMEVQPRTVERDIEYMRDRLGAPITYCHKRKGYYYENTGFQLPPLRLTEGELVALFLGQKLLAQCAGTPLEEPVRSAMEKVVTLLPEGVTVDPEVLDQSISFDMEPLRGDEQLVARVYSHLAAAVETRHTVWISYYSATRDEINERHVDPYHLRYYRGAWYLIAFCHWRQAIRIFALDRIRSITETDRTFTYQPGFSLADFLGTAFGIEMGDEPHEVSIRFSRHQSRWVRERQWHPTQRLEPQPDGSLILHMTVSGLGEVKRWVLGFGSHAEVLTPESLRQEIIRELIGVTEQYKSGK